jgi:Uma2 family endonuclease
MATDLSSCPVVSFKTTAADFRSWPEDGKRYELIDGEAYVSPSPFDVELDEENVFQPDVLVVLNCHSDRLLESHVLGAPDLVVEVLSPRTTERDRKQKFRQYAAKDVTEVWLADPLARTIEVNRRRDDGHLVLAETLGLDGTATTPLLPGLAIPVSRLFR